MTEPTEPPPLPPAADAGRRTYRTVLEVLLAVVITVGLSLPDVLAQVGIDPASVPGVALFVALVGVVARLMNTPPAERALTVIGAGKTPRHRA